MNQEIEARVLVTYAANVTLSADAIQSDVQAHVSQLVTSLHAGALEPMRVTVERIREEAAIYGNDVSPPFPMPAAPVAHVEPDDRRNPYDALGERVAALHAAVLGLLNLYQTASICDEITPEILSACYPASLDEWAANLGGAREELGALGGFYDKLAALGFSDELGGGGCVFLSTYRNGAAVWLTGEDGGYPTPNSWAVGVYPPPGPDEAMPDALWLMHSDSFCTGNAGARRMLEAAHAGIATAEAIGTDGDGEDYCPGDDPCPVNRCPKSRCPDSCDHGERGAR